MEIAQATSHLPYERIGRPRDALGSLVQKLAPLTGASSIVWPSTKWQADPVGFARDVLGVKKLWQGQIEILEAIRDNRNVTVRSGHKIGKSTALAIAALWFYSSFDRAKVFMTAVKSSQIDDAIWNEVRHLCQHSILPIGVPNVKAHSGLVASDGRKVWGRTARDAEGQAGISGANVLVLIDEASGVQDRFFEVLGSMLAGDGGTVRKCYISNPTRTTGEFFRSHTTQAEYFKVLHYSSEETPNAKGDKANAIPGLAGAVWLEELANKCGRDSAQYKIRALGEFVYDAEGKIIPLDLIQAAQAAWEGTYEEGDLQLGVDPAGDGVLGDETAIAVRRGNQIMTVLTWRGASEDDVVSHILGTLTTYRAKRETSPPRIAIDAEGGIGTRIAAKLRAHLDSHDGTFELVSVRSGKKMWGSPEYHLIRDALWGTAQKWIKAGGAIPDDAQLEQELNTPIFTPDLNQRYRATEKKELRKILERSPDRADAVCLAIWGFTSVGGEQDDPASASGNASTPPSNPPDDDVGSIDAYGAVDMWVRR